MFFASMVWRRFFVRSTGIPSKIQSWRYATENRERTFGPRRCRSGNSQRLTAWPQKTYRMQAMLEKYSNTVELYAEVVRGSEGKTRRSNGLDEGGYCV